MPPPTLHTMLQSDAQPLAVWKKHAAPQGDSSAEPRKSNDTLKAGSCDCTAQRKQTAVFTGLNVFKTVAWCGVCESVSV